MQSHVRLTVSLVIGSSCRLLRRPGTVSRTLREHPRRSRTRDATRRDDYRKCRSAAISMAMIVAADVDGGDDRRLEGVDGGGVRALEHQWRGSLDDAEGDAPELAVRSESGDGARQGAWR